MAKLTTIKDKDGVTTLYPLTKTNAVSDSNGTSLDSLLSAINQNKQDALTFDNTPTENSNNPVKSGGIKNYVDNHLTTATTLIGTNTVGTYTIPDISQFKYLLAYFKSNDDEWSTAWADTALVMKEITDWHRFDWNLNLNNPYDYKYCILKFKSNTRVELDRSNSNYIYLKGIK